MPHVKNSKKASRNIADAISLKTPGRLDKYERAEIKAAFVAGISVTQLSKEYRRTPQTIKRILGDIKAVT